MLLDEQRFRHDGTHPAPAGEQGNGRQHAQPDHAPHHRSKIALPVLDVHGVDPCASRSTRARRTLRSRCWYDEEVPRAGVHVTMRRRLARWIDGSTHVWTACRPQQRTRRGVERAALRSDDRASPDDIPQCALVAETQEGHPDSTGNRGTVPAGCAARSGIRDGHATGINASRELRTGAVPTTNDRERFLLGNGPGRIVFGEGQDDGGVDVLHLVGSLRAQPNLGFRGMHPEPGTAPAMLSDEAVPRRRRGPDLPETLGEDG